MILPSEAPDLDRATPELVNAHVRPLFLASDLPERLEEVKALGGLPWRARIWPRARELRETLQVAYAEEDIFLDLGGADDLAAFAAQAWWPRVKGLKFTRSDALDVLAGVDLSQVRALWLEGKEGTTPSLRGVHLPQLQELELWVGNKANRKLLSGLREGQLRHVRVVLSSSAKANAAVLRHSALQGVERLEVVGMNSKAWEGVLLPLGPKLTHLELRDAKLKAGELVQLTQDARWSQVTTFALSSTGLNGARVREVLGGSEQLEHLSLRCLALAWEGPPKGFSSVYKALHKAKGSLTSLTLELVDDAKALDALAASPGVAHLKELIVLSPAGTDAAGQGAYVRPGQLLHNGEGAALRLPSPQTLQALDAWSQRGVNVLVSGLGEPF